MKIFQIISFWAFVLVLSACNSGNSYEDVENDDARKIYKGEKIGFITEQMNFTELEAEQFWPIHRAFRNKMDSLWKEQKRFLTKNVKDGESENASDAVEAFISFERSKVEYQQEYVNLLRGFLSDDQILKIFYTEYQFKHFMLNRMRGRHGHREGKGMGRGRGRNMDGPQPPFEDHISANGEKCIR